MKFSANLGFLWTDRSLTDAIHAAKAAGFDAVECHWPYETPAEDVKAALEETGLKMLGLNTSRGDVAGGENGLSALPGREAEARAAIDQSISYAVAIDAGAIHVMAGFATGDGPRATFVNNLRYATSQAAQHGLTILIEPLNEFDAPGYHFHTTAEAEEIIATVGAPNLRLMFDCYHAGRMGEPIDERLTQTWSIIGHIQFASVPDRGPPDQGDVDYSEIFAQIAKGGWDQPLGAEYKPTGPTDASLDWMAALR